MIVRLHDNHKNPHLGEPTTVILAAIAIAKGIDSLVKQVWGSWAGFNGALLNLIGKHPSTDQQKIDETRNHVHRANYFVSRGWRNRKTDNLDNLTKTAQGLKNRLTDAKKGADSGDWVAARYLVVYAEMIEDVLYWINKRLEEEEKKTAGSVTKHFSGSDFTVIDATGKQIKWPFKTTKREIETRPKNSAAILAALALALTQI